MQKQRPAMQKNGAHQPWDPEKKFFAHQGCFLRTRFRFCVAGGAPVGGAGLGDARDQGSFLDITKNDNPLAKNASVEEQENRDGMLARN